MRVIVSTELEDKLNNFVVVDSLKQVQDLKGVTVLVIHKPKETDFEAGVFITTFHNNGIEQFLYINSNPSPTILMVLKGVGGLHYEDEFYLEDEEELMSLLEDIGMSDGSETTDLAAPALDVVNDFVQGFTRNEDRIKAPLYLENVKSALTELAEISHQQELQLSTMGSSALEVFERASTIIKNMDKQKKDIEKKLEDLEYTQANTAPSKTMFSNNINFFTPYKYIGNSKVLLIREYAPCRYLTSFVLGYLNHLHYELNRRPKLIFVHQKGAGVSAKYNAFTTIDENASSSMASLYDSEIIATNNPKKEVMMNLLNKPNDVIIVVDRLYGREDIVSGRITKVCAASSRSDIARYSLKAENTIFSVTKQPKELFTLGVIKGYPMEEDARLAAYKQTFDAMYKTLDRKIGLL
jgi:hypothetical protein